MKRIKDLKILVLKGGWSAERPISLKSARYVEDCLKEQGFKPESMDLRNIKEVKKIPRLNFDVAFIALHGGYGEGGGIQSFLESCHIPYTGSNSLSSALAMDKIESKKAFRAKNIPFPRYIVLEKRQKRKQCRQAMLRYLGLPLVVKPCAQGSTIGVSIVRQKKDLPRALRKAFRYDKKIIIEEFIKGKEITVGILGRRPLPVMELRPRTSFYDYAAKYKKGMCRHIIPAPLSPYLYRRAQVLALRAHQALGCRDFSRVDMRISKNKIYVLEVNTIPGMTTGSLLPEMIRFAGMSFGRVLIKLIRAAWRRKG